MTSRGWFLQVSPEMSFSVWKSEHTNTCTTHRMLAQSAGTWSVARVTLRDQRKKAVVASAIPKNTHYSPSTRATCSMLPAFLVSL